MLIEILVFANTINDKADIADKSNYQLKKIFPGV